MRRVHMLIIFSIGVITYRINDCVAAELLEGGDVLFDDPVGSRILGPCNRGPTPIRPPLRARPFINYFRVNRFRTLARCSSLVVTVSDGNDGRS